MMESSTYRSRRDEVRTYFDSTALDAWKRFAGGSPLGRIRDSVREGRSQMRETILSRLPSDLQGWRILDAGCGTGSISVALARRGACVVGVDLSPETIAYAQENLPADCRDGAIEFRHGDMLDGELGPFDAVVAMDSLIHYSTPDAVEALARLGARTRHTLLFTYVPRTPLLAAMHLTGRLFPKRSRAPSVTPTSPAAIAAQIAESPALIDWQAYDRSRVSHGFYTSELLELMRR